jgi:methyltransferase-like protein
MKTACMEMVYLKGMQRLMLTKKHDSYLFHDFMEEINEPLYFHQFMERAQAHNLQFLANADASETDKLKTDATNHLYEISKDIIEVEQYLDFLTNRMFRETVLCHKEISVSRTLRLKTINNLLIASHVKPDTPDFDISSTEPVEFHGPNKTRFSTDHPLTKAALHYLAQVWPRAVSFDELFTSAIKLLHPQTIGNAEKHILATNLLTTYSQNMKLVSLLTFMPTFVTSVSNKPVVCPTARVQAERGYPITNMYHRRVALNDMQLKMLPYMDGSKNHADLFNILVELTANGTLTLTKNDKPVEDLDLAKQILGKELEGQLQHLAQSALLTG